MKHSEIKEMARLRTNILRLFRELQHDEQRLAALKAQCDHAMENGDSAVKNGQCDLCLEDTQQTGSNSA